MTRAGRRFRLRSGGQRHPRRAALLRRSARRRTAPVPVSGRRHRLPLLRVRHPLRHRAPGAEGRLARPAGALYFVFGHVFVVFDHYTDTLTLLGINYHEHRIDLERALDETERRIDDLDFNFMVAARSRPQAAVVASGDESWYLDGVEFLRGEIIKGNLFQAVLSRRLVIETALAGAGGVSQPALDQSVSLHVLPGLRRVPALRRVAGGARQGRRRPRPAASDCRHPAPRRGSAARTWNCSRTCCPTRRSWPST